MLANKTSLQIKIVDFGISGICSGSIAERTEAGSIYYMAPEIFEGKTQASPKLDVWSIGVILYTMVYGELPYKGTTRPEIMKKILREEPIYPGKMLLYSSDLRDLIRTLLIKQPSKRPCVKDILKSDWVRDFQQVKLQRGPTLKFNDDENEEFLK
jgi:serine/threonine protein kinase